MKKTLSLFLALLMLAAVFTACSDRGGNEDGTTAAADATTASSPEETELPIPELDIRDFRNYEFIIIWPEKHPDGHFMHNEIAVESTSGDFIDDAVFRRNAQVESQYGVRILSELVWCSSIASKIKNDFSVGDKTYSAFCAPIGMVTSYAIEGICADYNDMEYYSEDYPWWDHTAMQDYSIANARFFGLGDIIVSDNFYPYSIFVNSEMYLDNRIEDDVFELVSRGKWTVDKMMEMGKNIPQSLDDTWSYDDTYGILINASMAKSLYYAFGKTLVRNNAEGYPEWIMTPEYAQSAIEKIVSVFQDDHIAYDTGDEVGHNMPGLSHAQTAVKMFSEGQALFYAEELITAERLKSSDMTFWVLPMPKYDEEQQNYHCVLNDATVVCVPANQDLERSSLILSALGRGSMDTLTPAFYDIVLASRYMKDPNSVAMLQLILRSAKAPDIATLMNYGTFISILKTLAQQGSTDFASQYNRFIKVANASLNALKKQIDEYNSKK